MNIKRIRAQLEHHTGEFMDGYILIGFVPGEASVQILSMAPDSKTALAINAILCSIVANGGVSVDKVKSRK